MPSHIKRCIDNFEENKYSTKMSEFHEQVRDFVMSYEEKLRAAGFSSLTEKAYRTRMQDIGKLKSVLAKSARNFDDSELERFCRAIATQPLDIFFAKSDLPNKLKEILQYVDKNLIMINRVPSVGDEKMRKELLDKREDNEKKEKRIQALEGQCKEHEKTIADMLKDHKNEIKQISQDLEKK